MMRSVNWTTSGRRVRQRLPLLMDLASHLAAWSAAFLIVGPIVIPDRSTESEVALVVGLTFAGWIIGHFNGVYTAYLGRERTETMLCTLRTLAIVTMTAALFGVAFNLASKELIIGVALIWALTVVGRSLMNAIIRVRRSHGKSHDRVLVVGANHEAARFIGLLDIYPELGLDTVGVVGNAAEASMSGLDDLLCGPLLSASTRVRELDARYAVVMTAAIPHGRLQEVIDQLQTTGVELMLSTDLGKVHHRRLQTKPIGFASVMLVEELSGKVGRLRLKRFIDVTLAMALLALSLPLQILAAIAIKLTDRGPVLYRQRRLGVGGTEFEVLRLRTMQLGVSPLHTDAEKVPVWDDPRMTWIGRLLEVTGVNESPQLWNVLRGEMSIVGPKPGYVALDADSDPLTMPPGVTGLWRTEANIYPANSVRHQLDEFYTQNWSLSLDIAVIMASIELIMIRLLRGASWRHARGQAPQVLGSTDPIEATALLHRVPAAS